VALAASEDGWIVRSQIIIPSWMPESARDRPTDAYRVVLMLVKGQWKSRVVKLANLDGERFQLGLYLRRPIATSPTVALCVGLVAPILDAAGLGNDLSLSALYAKVGQDGEHDPASHAIVGLPPIQRAAAIAARFLQSEITTKELLCQLNSMGLDLAEGDHLLIGDGVSGAAKVPLSPPIYADGEGAIAIQDSGQICQFDFLHDQIVTRSPSGAKYWYDAAAVRVAGSNNTHRRWPVGAEEPTNTDRWDDYREARGGRYGVFTDGEFSDFEPGTLRNLGNIWSLPPSSYPAAHFATFCLEEPELCIKASCPAEVCVKCGKARMRITEPGAKTRIARYPADERIRDSKMAGPPSWNQTDTLGWTDCGCESPEYEPGLVLDPFVGTGTTCVAAVKLGRRAIGIDASEEYLKQAVTRLTVGDAGVRRIVAAERAGAKQEVLL
jgi:hypothetical protein